MSQVCLMSVLARKRKNRHPVIWHVLEDTIPQYTLQYARFKKYARVCTSTQVGAERFVMWRTYICTAAAAVCCEKNLPRAPVHTLCSPAHV